MGTTGFGSTDVGLRRERNEDRLLVDTRLGLYAVADGMGGHAAGDLAATIAVDTVGRVVRRYLAAADVGGDGAIGDDVLGFIVRDAVRRASREVNLVAGTARGARGMGCTLTVLLTRGDAAALGHVGDSRLYRLRGGVVRQLSQDHTLVAELVRAGAVKQAAAMEHRCSHVLTRAVGTEADVEVDVELFELEDEDRFLLCSDGLNPVLGDETWLAEALEDEDLEAVVSRLIRRANEAGGEDNATAVVVAVERESVARWRETPTTAFEESSSGVTPTYG